MSSALELALVPHKRYPISEVTDWSFSAEDGNRLLEAGGGEDTDSGWEKYKAAHTWFDPGLEEHSPPRVKAAYKLPHHKLDSEGNFKTFRRGVTAAMGALLGARGGPDIPQDEKKSVYNHLARHYEEMEMSVPEFHLSEDYFAEFQQFSEFKLGDAGARVSEVQLLRVGSWKHPQYGSFAVTAKDLTEFKENFNARVRGNDLAIDQEHEPEKGAAGWIKSLTIKGGRELWAKIEWTDWGLDLVKKKLFRYISADFHKSFVEPESGKKVRNLLNGAALTNRPFVKNMAAVVLSERGVMLTADGALLLSEPDPGGVKLATDIEIAKSRLAQLRNLGVEVTDEMAVLDELAKLSDDAFNMMLKLTTQLGKAGKKLKMGPEISLQEEEEEEEMPPEGATASEEGGPKPVTISAEQLGAVTKKLGEAEERIAEMEGQLAEATRKSHAETVEARLSQFVEKGKLHPAERAIYQQMLTTDEGQAMQLKQTGEDGKETTSPMAEQIYTMLESRQAVIQLGEQTGAASPEEKSETDELTAIGERIGKKYALSRGMVVPKAAAAGPKE